MAVGLTGRLILLLPLLFGLFLLTGCGRNAPLEPAAIVAVQPTGAPPPVPALDDVLKMPREELAKRCNELIREIELREKARRDGNLKFSLLDLHLPKVWPVFHELKYSKEHGLSLPPYVKLEDPTGEKETWLHYARFGDYEAAVKLAGNELAKDLAALKGEANYPVEWTRWVAIQNYALQQRVATAEKDAFTALLQMREQLEKVLNDKAKQGPLGQVLLPRGRRTVQLATTIWRSRGESELAEAGERALAKWPPLAEAPVFGWKEPKSYWANVLKSSAKSRIVVADPPKRGLDLLQIPFPADALDAVVFCFDSKDQIQELLVVYGPRAQQTYPLASDFTAVLGDWLAVAPETTTDYSLRASPSYRWEANLCREGPTLGGWLRLVGTGPQEAAVLPREFAGFHLDRSFDLNKQLLGIRVKNVPLVLTQEKDLNRLNNPLPLFPLQQAILHKPDKLAFLQEAIIHYDATKTQTVPPHQFFIPLMAMFGPGRLVDEPPTRAFGPHLRVLWQDAVTEIVLRIPYSNRENVQFDFRDRREPDKSAEERKKEVAAFEKEDRGRRLREGKALEFLNRNVEQEQFRLGAPRNEVLSAVRRGQRVYRKDIPDGLVVFDNSALPNNRTYMVRQWVLRFDKEDRLASIRARIVPVVTSRSTRSNWTADFLKTILLPGGIQMPHPSPYETRDHDLPPPQVAPTFTVTEDDQTRALFWLDWQNGAELVLENRPIVEQAAQGPLSFLPRGIDKTPVVLGAGKKELQAKYPDQTVTTNDGAWVVQPGGNVYDAVLVWFENDKVKKIAARHREDVKVDPKTKKPVKVKAGPQEMAKRLNDRWGAEMKQVGWPMRQDVTSTVPTVLQALTWFDDVTRYRLYWAEGENTPPRLWSEWRDDTP